MWFFLWSKWCLEVFIYSFTCYSHLNPKTEQKYHESCVDAISFSTCYSNVIILWKIAADTQRWRQIYLHIWWSYPNNEKSVQMFCEDVNCLLSSIVKVRRWNRQRSPKRFVENDDYNRFVSYMFAESNCNIEGLYTEGSTADAITLFHESHCSVENHLRMLPIKHLKNSHKFQC